MPNPIIICGGHPGTDKVKPLNLDKIRRVLKRDGGVDAVAGHDSTWLIRAVTYKPIDPEVLEKWRAEIVATAKLVELGGEDMAHTPKRRRRQRPKLTTAPDEEAKAAIAEAQAGPPPREVDTVGDVVASVRPYADEEFGDALIVHLDEGLAGKARAHAEERALDVALALKRGAKVVLFDPEEGGEVDAGTPYIHDPLENAPSHDLDPDLADDGDEDMW